jgi:cytochrome oxidase assembly protein ShyY1
MGGVDLLRSPKWLVGHVIALAAVVAFVSLGFWQLRRLDERLTRNATVSERLDAEPAPLADLFGEFGEDGEALASRRAVATGTYLVDEEVRLSTRSYRGQPGHHLLTPLLLDDGRALLVDRGWVPLPFDDPPVAEATPPGGTVTVTGVLEPAQEPSMFGVRVPEGETPYLGVPDLGRLQQQVDAELVPVWVQLQAQDPPNAGDLPVPAELPRLDEGPHRSYAGQWFLFAVVVAVGYPVLLRRQLRRPHGGAAPEEPALAASGADERRP